MGCKTSKPELPPAVGALTRICMAGVAPSPELGHAKKLILLVTAKKAAEYESYVYITGLGDTDAFQGFVKKVQFNASDSEKAKALAAPFCWLELEDGSKTYLGNATQLKAWITATFADDAEIVALAAKAPNMSEDATFAPGSFGTALK